MSYVLINGKRYYKDDHTGRTTLDNVSQAEADQRAQRTQYIARTPNVNYSQTVTGNVRTTNSTSNAIRTSNVIHTPRTAGTTANARFPWKVVIACVVIVLFIRSCSSTSSQVSSEERAIANYMNVQQSQVSSKENATLSTYLVQDSARRYLKASDIKGYSHDEIQMIINAIYARHGRVFRTKKINDYFCAQVWYEPVYGKSDKEIENEFNSYEKANIELLCKYR